MTNKTFKTFKARLASNDIVLAPGVYDALSALVAEQAGFEALYLSGASIAYTRLGRSDVGLTTFTEVADTLARITERVNLPVIVDADTGFGNALNTQRTVRGFERAGAAMIQIEDQTFPKRCGHLDGKSGGARAAKWVRQAQGSAGRAHFERHAHPRSHRRGRGRRPRRRARSGRGLPGLRRGRTLHRGAAQRRRRSTRRCGRFAARVPLLANMVEGGKTPIQDADALQAHGFRIAIFPGGTARAVVHTLQGYYGSLHAHRTTQPWRSQMLDFDALNEVIGTPELMRTGKKYE